MLQGQPMRMARRPQPVKTFGASTTWTPPQSVPKSPATKAREEREAKEKAVRDAAPFDPHPTTYEGMDVAMPADADVQSFRHFVESPLPPNSMAQFVVMKSGEYQRWRLHVADPANPGWLGKALMVASRVTARASSAVCGARPVRVAWRPRQAIHVRVRSVPPTSFLMPPSR